MYDTLCKAQFHGHMVGKGSHSECLVVCLVCFSWTQFVAAALEVPRVPLLGPASKPLFVTKAPGSSFFSIFWSSSIYWLSDIFNKFISGQHLCQ